MFVFKIVILLNVLIFHFKEVAAEYEKVCYVKRDERLKENIVYPKNKENNVYPKNCADLLEMGDTQSGIRKVFPYPSSNTVIVNVVCDQETDGGGWTVIQYRKDNNKRENFYRRWMEYKLGFGYLNKEFWLGLDNIHVLVSDTLMELRVDLEDYEGAARWAKYHYFYISDEAEKYRLDVGNYSGNAGDGLRRHLGMKFTTHDQDNDIQDEHNCATRYKGAWWYENCHDSNLNGFPYKGKHNSSADGINWEPFRGDYYSLKKTKLSIRPKFIYIYMLYFSV